MNTKKALREEQERKEGKVVKEDPDEAKKTCAR